MGVGESIFMTYCTHLIFCIDDTQSALEAKKKWSVFAVHGSGRLAQLTKQPALFKILLNFPQALRLACHLCSSIWGGAATANSPGRDWETSRGWIEPCNCGSDTASLQYNKYSNAKDCSGGQSAFSGQGFHFQRVLLLSFHCRDFDQWEMNTCRKLPACSLLLALSRLGGCW